jgi:putative endonuclease
MYTVYVLYSKEYNKIYIGFTSDINQRLFAHNHPNNKGWTKRFQPWKIVYTEEFGEKQAAMKREKELKSSRGRAFIREKIQKQL